MMRIVLFILLLSSGLCKAHAQRLHAAKRIKAKGDYMHTATGTVFPLLINGYDRVDISSFDKKKENISGEYLKTSTSGPTKINVYIYPSVEIESDRLKQELLYAIRAVEIAQNLKLKPDLMYCSYIHEGYKLNGYKAFFILRDDKSFLEVYECGKWLFKIRITSSSLSKADMDKLADSLVEVFTPTNLVKSLPLSLRPSIAVNPAALDDSLLLAMTISRALEECLWAQNNIDSIERIAGFPSVYVDMYASGFKHAAVFADTIKTIHGGEISRRYLSQLHELLNTDYLDEFIWDLQGVPLVPYDRHYDFDKFYKWKKTHDISALYQQLYVIKNSIKEQ